MPSNTYAPFEVEGLLQPVSSSSTNKKAANASNPHRPGAASPRRRSIPPSSSASSRSSEARFCRPRPPPPPPSNTNSTHGNHSNPTARRRWSFGNAGNVRGRVKILLVGLGCLVVVALFSDVWVSTEMTALLDEEEEDNNRAAESSHWLLGNSTSNFTAITPSAPSPSRPPAFASTWTDNNATVAEEEGGGPLLPPPPPLLPGASELFRARWCDVAPSEWFPTGSNAWQLMAPYALVPGADHAGGVALAHYLRTVYPSQLVTASPSTQGQFYPKAFRTVRRGDDRTHVALARARLYARDYAAIRTTAATLQQQQSPPLALNATTPSTSSSLQLPRGIDPTSGYLFYAPTRILCVLPWVRVLVVLRDPVDRLWEHYCHSRDVRHYRGTPEEWYQSDWRRAERAGLVELRSSRNRTALTAAWDAYRSNNDDNDNTAVGESPIGRGLYEPQLRAWLEGLRAVGRDLTTDVLVIFAEDLLADPNRVLAQVAAFLGLEPSPREDAPQLQVQQQQQQELLLQELGMRNGLVEASQQKLRDFFQPYQRQLKRLLQSYRVPTSSPALASAAAAATKKKKKKPGR